jgi:ATP-binding cassette subfamily B protein
VLLAAAMLGVLLVGTVALSERRAAFVSAVTHELRTPLTTLRTYTEMLAGGMVPEEKRPGYLETLSSQATRLAHLVDNVLLYSRLERGRGPARLERCDARELVEAARPRLEERAAAAGMTVEVEAPAGLTARADPSAVEQILFNLVDQRGEIRRRRGHPGARGRRGGRGGDPGRRRRSRHRRRGSRLAVRALRPVGRAGRRVGARRRAGAGALPAAGPRDGRRSSPRAQPGMQLRATLAHRILMQERGVKLSRLLALAAPEWRRLSAATLFLLVGSAMALLYPQAIRMIIDGALARGLGAIDDAALLLGGIFLVEGVAVGLRALLFSVAGERVVTRLRQRLYRSILAQEIGFFDRHRTGELTSRLASDTTVLQQAVSSNLSMGLRYALTVAGGIGFLLFTSPRLTSVMLLIVPPVALAAVFFGRRLRRLARKVQDALARAGEQAEESIAGVRTVRSFAAEAEEARRYDDLVEHSFELARRRARFSATFMGLMTIAGYGAGGAVIWLGGRLVAGDQMSVGQLTSFVVYTLSVAFSLGALGDVWAELMRASGAASRVFELLDRVPEIPTEGGRQLELLEGRVELDGVDFTYPARPDLPVLHGVSLRVAAGEAVALVGPSGAGKSTVAALLSRLYDPTAGRLLLDGTDLRELDPAWLRRQIGVVSQEPILFSGTIADNIRYGRPEASDAEVEAAARGANAHDFISGFPDGYRTMVGERGVQLSGGQKQRVAIARAMLKDPRVLILDEATSALDAESEHLVKEATSRLMRGRTTLIIAHRLSTVRDAHRVAVLEAGPRGPERRPRRAHGRGRRLPAAGHPAAPQRLIWAARRRP